MGQLPPNAPEEMRSAVTEALRINDKLITAAARKAADLARQEVVARAVAEYRASLMSGEVRPVGVWGPVKVAVCVGWLDNLKCRGLSTFGLRETDLLVLDAEGTLVLVAAGEEPMEFTDFVFDHSTSIPGLILATKPDRAVQCCARQKGRCCDKPSRYPEMVIYPESPLAAILKGRGLVKGA